MGFFNLFKNSKNKVDKNKVNTNNYNLLDKESLLDDGGEAKDFETLIYDKVEKCPYCGERQSDIPYGEGEVVCTNCNKIIYVLPSYLSDEKLLLNEDDYNKLKNLRRNFKFYRKVSSNLSSYGMSKEDIDTSSSNNPDPLDRALILYDRLLDNPPSKSKYDFLSLAYYQVSNIKKFQNKEEFLDDLLLSMYYDYLFGYDLNFFMNETNVLKVKGFIPFVPEYNTDKLVSLKESNKSIEEIKNIFNEVVKEDKFKDESLKSIISCLEEKEGGEPDGES